MSERKGRSRPPAADDPELRELRERIDAVDRRIVDLLNQRARLTLDVGHRKAALGRAIRDTQREREVLLRVSIANEGPMPQADLISLYRDVIASARGLEARERDRLRRDDEGPGEPPSA